MMEQEVNRNGHEPTTISTERCPWCNSPVTHERFAEIEVKIRQQEQIKLAESTKQLRAQLDAQHAAELIRQRKLSEQQMDTLLKARLKELDTEREKVYADQRAGIEKDRDLAILKAQAEFNRERESLQAKVKDVERQLQHKTSQGLGDDAEIDLFKALTEAFPGDRITRVPKGQNGAMFNLKLSTRGSRAARSFLNQRTRSPGKTLLSASSVRTRWLPVPTTPSLPLQHSHAASEIFASSRM
jgi:hypothetical protein